VSPAADGWLVVPVLVPLLAAMLLVPVVARWRLARAVSLASVGAQLAVAVALVRAAAGGTVLVHRFGDWPVPYGIVFVADRLAALMLALTAALALAALAHAVRGEDREGAYFHTLFHLQLAGLNGAFLTGDLFTLFVFFEVLLIASYCLLVHGATPARVRWGVHYVVLNLVGSTLFLVAAGVLYGLLGTLNLAELARRVATLAPADAAPVRAAALLLLTVFALKAALAPLHLWLPGTYAAAGASVAALFAIMTKVGVYAVLRVFGVVFGPAGGALAGTAAPWLFPAALATAMLGAIAAFGVAPTDDSRVRRQAASLLVTSVGTVVASVAGFDLPGVAAGLYYLVHSTLAAGAMFLVVALTVPPADASLGAAAGRRIPAGVTGALFVAGAVAVTGLPPLSGLIGKALILAAAPTGADGAWLWVAVLASSLLGVLALVRSGGALFWERASHTGHPAAHALPAVGLLAALVALTVFAQPALGYAAAAAEQLLAAPTAPRGYTAAVLAAPGGR
jgi:multicomponent K+:H+ antiporter subunit D